MHITIAGRPVLVKMFSNRAGISLSFEPAKSNGTTELAEKNREKSMSQG